MGRLNGTIFSYTNAQWLSRTKRLGSKQLGYNKTTGELRQGPGYWDECAPTEAGAHADLSVRVATTANITIATALNGGDTIDVVVLADGDKVLVKNNATAGLCGIYTAGDTPARTVGYTTYDSLVGLLIYVSEGTTNGGRYYLNTDDAGGTIDDTAVDFVQVYPQALNLAERLQFSYLTAKAAGVAADLLLLEDSEEGGLKKRMSLADLKTSLASIV